jgi:hypothetical protein
MSSNETKRRLIVGLAVLVLLSLCLTATTFAIVWATVSVENNLFHTGIVKINLNDGKPIINEEKFLFEPGATLKRDFFIENLSTWEVYYKVYMLNLEGDLGDKIYVKITPKDSNDILYEGLASELTRARVHAADDTLEIGERAYFTAYFTMPKNVGNEGQGLELAFDVGADAVQTKNNPNKLFD